VGDVAASSRSLLATPTRWSHRAGCSGRLGAGARSRSAATSPPLPSRMSRARCRSSLRRWNPVEIAKRAGLAAGPLDRSASL